MNDRKVLCFRKSVGTPYAVYQIKAGPEPGELQYQVAGPTEWSTLSVPNFWTHPNVTTRVTVVHDGAQVSIYRNATLMLHANLSRLDYDNAEAMVVGTRKGDEFWLGEVGPLTIKVGAFPPSAAAGLTAATKLPAPEVAALADMYNSLGGRFWMYRRYDSWRQGI